MICRFYHFLNKKKFFFQNLKFIKLDDKIHTKNVRQISDYVCVCSIVWCDLNCDDIKSTYKRI